MRKVRHSTGDLRAIANRYMRAEFWLDQSNWFWYGNWKYSYNTQAELYDRLVKPALKEMEKKGKEDFLNLHK